MYTLHTTRSEPRTPDFVKDQDGSELTCLLAQHSQKGAGCGDGASGPHHWLNHDCCNRVGIGTQRSTRALDIVEGGFHELERYTEWRIRNAVDHEAAVITAIE